MTIRTRLTDLLGIKHPILLAPMDMVSGGRLAAAVSRAGGLGLLGGGYGNSEWIRHEWERAASARIGCGFITWSLAERPEVLKETLAYKPAAIMLSFGDPRPFSAAIRASGAYLICQVQTVMQAHEAMEAGADIIVAQGTEAGGHGMSEPLFTLLPQVVDACPGTVVVAAGGVADGRGLAASLMLGAQGVLVGTRFYASEEAEGSPEAKRRIVDAGAGQSVRSTTSDQSRHKRWPAQYSSRLLSCRRPETWLGREGGLDAIMEEIGFEYMTARESRNFGVADIVAGEACAMIHDVAPARAIIERVIAEAEGLLKSYNF